MTSVPADAAETARKPDHLAALRPEALAVPESGIVELFNHGRGRQGLIPLWVGEGDLGSPAAVIAAEVVSRSRISPPRMMSGS